MTDRRGQQIIDGYPVRFVSGYGWICSCEQFDESKFCVHADKAAAIAEAEAQADRRDKGEMKKG
jgi:hypothetical protein